MTANAEAKAELQKTREALATLQAANKASKSKCDELNNALSAAQVQLQASKADLSEVTTKISDEKQLLQTLLQKRANADTASLLQIPEASGKSAAVTRTSALLTSQIHKALGVAPADVDRCLEQLHGAGYMEAVAIGEVTPSESAEVIF